MARKAIIPISRPLLPKTQTLLPYLERIDKERFYSNFGPLNTELENRVTERLGSGINSVTTVSSATAGLTATLISLIINHSRKKDASKLVCLLPAWTFVATFHAVVSAGLEPFLLDVDLRHGKQPPTSQEEPFHKSTATHWQLYQFPHSDALLTRMNGEISEKKPELKL